MAKVLVTGANRGIGLELCRQFRSKGDEVIGVCRKASPELKSLGVRVEEGVDVSDPASVSGLPGRLSGLRLDVVVNNAGLLERDGLETPDDEIAESIKRQFEVNALGPFLVSKALLPLLGEGGKIAIITSRMGSIADNTSGSYYGYRMSKAAVNIAGVSLACDLKDRGIAVAIIHPGFVRTDMTDGRGNMDPEESARGILARIEELDMDGSGTFRHSNGERLPW